MFLGVRHHLLQQQSKGRRAFFAQPSPPDPNIGGVAAAQSAGGSPLPDAHEADVQPGTDRVCVAGCGAAPHPRVRWSHFHTHPRCVQGGCVSEAPQVEACVSELCRLQDLSLLHQYLY